MQQCFAGANYGCGYWREIARGADIEAAPPLGPGLPDCHSDGSALRLRVGIGFYLERHGKADTSAAYTTGAAAML